MNNNEYLKILSKLNILYIEDEEKIKENVKATLKLFCENILMLQLFKRQKSL